MHTFSSDMKQTIVWGYLENAYPFSYTNINKLCYRKNTVNKKKSVHSFDAVPVTVKEILLVPTNSANYDSHPQLSISKTEELVEDF